MLINVTKTALKSKMLSATCRCYLPHAQPQPVLSATLVLGQNSAFQTAKILASNKLELI